MLNNAAVFEGLRGFFVSIAEYGVTRICVLVELARADGMMTGFWVNGDACYCHDGWVVRLM